MKNRFLFATLFVFLCATAIFPQKVTKQKISAEEEQRRYKLAAEYSQKLNGLSVLVMKGDKVVFEEYQNGHNAEKPNRLASGTKSFTGLIAAAAVQDGFLKFDEKVSDTITEWKTDAQKSKITIRQILSLTSGLETGENGKPPSYSEAIEFKAKYDAGTKFEYGPVSFQVFGEVMRRKLLLQPKKENVLDYLKRRILDPIGLNVAYWAMQDGQPNLPSGAFLTAREWAKYGTFIKYGGKWNGKQIVPKKILDECFIGSRANPSYGLSFWLNHAGGTDARGRAQTETDEISSEGILKSGAKDLVMAAGAGKQRLYIIPSLDLVIVRQGDNSPFRDAEFLSRLLDGKVLNQAAETSPKPVQ